MDIHAVPNQNLLCLPYANLEDGERNAIPFALGTVRFPGMLNSSLGRIWVS